MQKEHVAFKVLNKNRSDIRKSDLGTEMIRVSDIKNVRAYKKTVAESEIYTGDFSCIYLDRGRGSDDPMVIVLGSVETVCSKLGVELPTE